MSANAALLAQSLRGLPVDRRAMLAQAVTIGMDSTDVEVYGRLKLGVA